MDCLIETVLLSTHNTCFGLRNKKKNQLQTLRPEFLYELIYGIFFFRFRVGGRKKKGCPDHLSPPLDPRMHNNSESFTELFYRAILFIYFFLMSPEQTVKLVK